MPWRNTPADRQRQAQTYGDPEYKRNRALCLDRDGHRCQLRLDGCTHLARTVDHVIPVSRGGTHALANLQAACWHCHRRKTAQEGGGYRGTGSSAADPEPVARTPW